MGNTLSSCPCRKHRINSIREITLLMVGLDNAGKTCTAKHLTGESTADPVPTVGFSSVKILHGKFQVTIYDLGGGPKIRGIWKSYYALVHGVIFVVDASDPVRLDECRNEIADMLKNEKISGKPILLLVNKHDVNGAMDETELVDLLELESLVNKQKCPTRVEASCALWDKGMCKDRGIREGFNWIVGHISNDFRRLNERVAKERAEQRIQEEKEKSLREERVRKLREEREKQDAVQQCFEGSSAADNDDSDVIIGNPFKSVHQIKAEFDKKEKGGSIREYVPPGVQIIHVSPTHSATKNVKCEDNSNSLTAILSKMQVIENSLLPNSEIPETNKILTSTYLHHLTRAEEFTEKRKNKKVKKRFRNRINPEISELHGNTHLSRPFELPPIKSGGDIVPNGHLTGYLSPCRSPIKNGKINWALAEELAPCEEKMAT